MTIKDLLENKKIDKEIYLTLFEEIVFFCLRIDTGEFKNNRLYYKYIQVIEKVTGLTWQQVKNTITFK